MPVFTGQAQGFLAARAPQPEAEKSEMPVEKLRRAEGPQGAGGLAVEFAAEHPLAAAPFPPRPYPGEGPERDHGGAPKGGLDAMPANAAAPVTVPTQSLGFAGQPEAAVKDAGAEMSREMQAPLPKAAAEPASGAREAVAFVQATDVGTPEARVVNNDERGVEPVAQAVNRQGDPKAGINTGSDVQRSAGAELRLAPPQPTPPMPVPTPPQAREQEAQPGELRAGGDRIVGARAPVSHAVETPPTGGDTAEPAAKAPLPAKNTVMPDEMPRGRAPIASPAEQEARARDAARDVDGLVPPGAAAKDEARRNEGLPVATASTKESAQGNPENRPPPVERPLPEPEGRTAGPATDAAQGPTPQPGHAAPELASGRRAESGPGLATDKPGMADAPIRPADVGPGEARAATAPSNGTEPIPGARADQARTVALQIAEVVRVTGQRAVELRLQPEELGRVSLSMSQEGAQLQVTLVAERSETLDLMRRHIDILGEELRRLGHGSVQFTFEDGARQDRGAGARQSAPDEQAAMPGATGPAVEPTADAPRPYRQIAGTGGMDIRM
ncbi:flagellar hook-length control protein FliK [Sinisalibacter lacisalsi]|uniref:Flagellar hook-length control protein-like C-terminal domain-containing protein n=1 Tax=Sinisalibacter lacisalsi TaxID=1526570 RepID=A0ABQ1QEV3_9RHOB|nr:flagellar hook-length control protein FliK [Sinisalibacter lacisalsi]GGD22954.1 hypothetical protein GCM10011358_04390 [Sinisalibacter lacisalsi]